MLYIAFSMQRCLMVIEVAEKYMLEFEFFFCVFYFTKYISGESDLHLVFV